MEADEELPYGSIFLFLLASAIYYFLFKNTGDVSISKPIVHIFLVALCILGGSSVVWISRYYMPHVTCNGHSGSIYGKPVRLVDNHGIAWNVFNTGDSMMPVYMRGKLCTLVVPVSQMNEANNYWVGKTFVKLAPLKALPSVIYRFLVRHSSDYNLDKVKYGFHAEEFVHQEPQIASYEAQIENLNSQINLRDDLIERRNDELIEMVEFGKSVSGIQGHWYDFLKPKQQVPVQNA